MRILFIGPHPDDCEIGCSGTVARFVEEGHEVWFHILGKAFENSVPKLSDNLYREAEKAAKALGICN
jgi:LmbE family N-acetylglucosaminyl deacetylase